LIDTRMLFVMTEIPEVDLTSPAVLGIPVFMQ